MFNLYLFFLILFVDFVSFPEKAVAVATSLKRDTVSHAPLLRGNWRLTLAHRGEGACACLDLALVGSFLPSVHAHQKGLGKGGRVVQYQQHGT